jgi:hypothetical protein
MAKAFDPTADVKAGEWIEGPDGRLDMDVAIRGTLDGKPTLVVIECKDFDLTKTGKVGRPFSMLWIQNGMIYKPTRPLFVPTPASQRTH